MLTHASPDRLTSVRAMIIDAPAASMPVLDAPPVRAPVADAPPVRAPVADVPVERNRRAAANRIAANRIAVSRIAVSRRAWPWVRVLGGLAILGFLGWRVGTGGFIDGLRLVNVGTLLAASGIGLLTTVLSAWRWCLIARGLGTRLPLTGATADYYRALFLNAALPGGILGDVHRAVRHGRDVGDVGLGVRAVVLERFAGQVVLIAVTVSLLVALPSPVLSALPLPRDRPAAVMIAVVIAVMIAVVVAVTARKAVRAGAARRLRQATSRWGRGLRVGVASLRHGLLARSVWPGVVVSSVAVLAGYLATFLLAARAAGVTAPLLQLLPLVVLALLAMAVPVNIGGWGPREGACAWAFGVAGLGAAQGLTVAVVYGVSVFVASLPGAAVLVTRARRARTRPA